ncbi:MAG: lactonase family protein, partial [Chloroflexi bacterium]|nr:lactonase family protein [Chloroflexota bacterium]
MTQQNREFFVFIGTYTRLGSEGIYVYRMDASGKLSYASKATGIEDPSFLATDPQRRYLYAASEVQEFEGKRSGVAYAYSINAKTGELAPLNRQPTGSPGPCHLTVDKTSKYLLVANYHGGALTVFPIQRDGSLGAASDFVQHEGSSVNPNRQKEAHAHSINLDSSNRFAFAPDLGMDKIMIY